MSGKKGRKCSIAHCNSFQHTHKSLSFFRFPKDPERCKAWIAVSGRPELADKLNVYEDRVCEKHFEPNMFLNDYRNRLQNTAVPVLCLEPPPPPPPRVPRPPNQLKIVGKHLMLKNSFEQPSLKRMKMDNVEDDLLEIMKPPVAASERAERKKYCIAPQKTYLDACEEMRKTGISFRKAAEKYNVNYVTLRRFCSRLNKSINGMSSIPQPQANQMQPDVTIQPINNLSQLKRSPTSLISPQISSQIASQIHAQIQSQIQSQIKMQIQTPSPPIKVSRPKIPQIPAIMPNQSSAAPSVVTNANNSAGYKRPRQIFSVEQEEELAVFVRDASNYYNGMSSKDVRILAFVYGVCNQVDLPVGWRESHQASFDWCLGFIKRNKLTPMMTSSHQFRNTGNMNGMSGKDKILNEEKSLNTDDIPKAEIC